MDKFKLYWGVLVLVCIVTSRSVLSEEGAATATVGQEERQVVMFSATYCPACGHAKLFFKQHNIPYLEFDIEKSAAARSYFDRLGGRGTPFLLINNRRMQGFSEQRFWHYYRLSKP